MITETEALKSLDISDFRHPTKDTMIKMVSMLDQMDPEVAEKILEQFPEFASTARGILTEYKELLDEGLKSNNESIKNVYDTYNTIIVSLRKELENEDLTFEQKKYIIEQMKEIAGIIYKKDTENKKFTDPLSTTYGSSDNPFTRGSLNVESTDNFNWNLNAFLAYNNSIGKNYLNLSFGVNAQETQSSNLSAAYRGFPSAALHTVGHAKEIVTKPSGADNKTRLMGVFLSGNYSWDNIFLGDMSIRFDGSSKLAEGNKWGSFPSAAVAWRVSGEEFMKSLSWLSNLKLRLSYGQTGNDNVSAYQTQGSISGAKYYTFGSSESIGYVPNNLRNLDLGWERTTEYNVGLDFGFFNNRISGSVEYYNRLTEDLIMNKTVPVTTGYSSVKANVGSVRNEGFEVNINSDNIRTKDFSWRTSLNFAYNKNNIVDLQYKENLTSRGLSLAGMSGDYSNLWIIGQPIDINYNLMTLGVWQLDEAEEAAKYGCKPGQYKPLDLNEDGVIDDKDRVIDGKRTPDWTGGMTNTFTYKEFDLSFQAAFQAGARARNQFYVSYALENNNLNFNNLRKDYWTPENPTNASAQPSNLGTFRSKAGSCGNAKSEMSHTMFSSNFLKISYITLGYTFKPSVLEKMKLGNLRLYATVQNPFIFCSKVVVDPEQLNVSINTSDAMTRNVIFGINFTICVISCCRQSTVRRTNHRLAYRNVLAAVGWYSLLENNFRRVLLRIVTLYIKIFNLLFFILH